MLAVSVFVAVALLAYWPVEPLSTSQIVSCACGDQVQEVWFLAWAAHALSHGVNPFFTNDINYPHGVNLAVNTTMPLLGVIAAPVTWLRGAVAAYNVMMRLAFATSATSMLFVTRRFTRGWLGPFLAGLLYGFSPYMVGEGNGHLFLTFVPLPPLLFLAVYELCCRQAARPRRWGIVLGLLAAAQYFISLEVLASTAICCAIGLVVAVVLRPAAARGRAVHALAGLGWALVVFAPIVAYPTYYFLHGPQHVTGPPQSVAALAPYRVDLFGPIVPTIEQRIGPASLVARGTAYAAGNIGENGIYLGIPLLLLLLVLLVRFRRDLLLATVAVVGLVAFVLSLGSPLMVDNHDTGIPLPFALLTRFPPLEGLLAARFSLYVQLAASFVLAVGVDRLLGDARGVGPRHVRTLGTGLLAAAVLVPLVPRLPYSSAPTAVPAYFSSLQARRIPDGGVVLTYPYDYSPYNDGMLWEALSGFRFKIIGGEATRPGPDGTGTSAVDPLAPTELQNLFRAGLRGSASPVPAPPVTGLGLARVREFFPRWHVGTVVVDPVGADPGLVVRYLTVALRRPPVQTGGVDVWYRVSGG